MAKPHVLLDPANFWLWLVPALLIAVAGGIGTELVKDPSSARLWICLIVDLGVVALLGLLLSAKVRQMMAEIRLIKLDINKDFVPRAKSLIVFVSMPPGSGSAIEAARYHAANGTLEELWMITSEVARAEAERIAIELRAQFPNLAVHPPVCVADIYSIPEAKSEVENIRKKALRKHTHEADVMCDFTGFTKSMSAGMILACAPKEARLQFMHPKVVLPDGRADPKAGSYPVEVKIAYQIEED